MNKELEKLKCTKQTVLNYLYGIEQKYNKKYVEQCNNIKNGFAVNAAREKARMFSDMKTAIQLLINEFENDFKDEIKIKNELPVYKYLDISTAHISPETNDFLKRESSKYNSEFVIYEKDGGFFINVFDIDDIKNILMPDDLRECLELAIKQGCAWLVLDGDAEVIDELQTYKW